MLSSCISIFEMWFFPKINFLLRLRNSHGMNIRCPLIAAHFKLFLVTYANMIYGDNKKSRKYTFDQTKQVQIYTINWWQFKYTVYHPKFIKLRKLHQYPIYMNHQSGNLQYALQVKTQA